MNLKNQRRMAAIILKCGENRVWMDPNRLEDIEDSITRADVRTLIASGTIAAAPKKGVSRGRARHVASRNQKGEEKAREAERELRTRESRARRPGSRRYGR